MRYARQPVRYGSIGPGHRLHSCDAFDSSDEIEEASAVSGEFVVTGCDVPVVFDLVEEAFDEISLFAEPGIEAAPLRGCGSARIECEEVAGGPAGRMKDI